MSFFDLEESNDAQHTSRCSPQKSRAGFVPDAKHGFQIFASLSFLDLAQNLQQGWTTKS